MTTSKITVTVRAPNRNSDHVLECKLEWNVLKLKEMIFETYPGKPVVSNQRLIHGGKYLQDNETLNELFKDSNNPIIHLVLVPSGPCEMASCVETPAMTTSASDSNILHHRHGQLHHSQTTPWMSWQQGSMAAYYHHHHHSHSHEQYQEMWRRYEQHMNHYMQYYGQGHAQQQGHVQAAGSAPAPEPAQQRAAPQANNIRDGNPAMNAQGGFALPDNEDDVAPDWLDVLFTLVRYGFFLSVIYFYSSFWRFLLVVSLFLILYIYQSGFFQAQRRPWHPDELERRNNERVPAPTDTDDNNNDNSSDENNESASPATPPPPSIFATAWCFVTTFFTSLIPQPPPVV